MHGRVQRNEESCRSLRRSSSQHMRLVPSWATINRTVAAVGDHSSVFASTTSSSSSGSFFKGGRKFFVGDCALFKPPQGSPPFIGIIRWLSSSKENNLQLGVNWLYRPADLKLGRGIQLDAEPNEIFYSFHKDEIPAASILHPCKVAFLPKGVELPAGTSSFVCRRVYDIEYKCLWWLTDQDYINERQEEVNQLLYKTQTQMHATVQSGCRSPKPVNDSTSTMQPRSGSDNGQIGSASFATQVKGKKRERGDQGADPVKRERSSKTDDGDAVKYKVDSNLKAEIAKITEKGGLVELEGVEKLVQLMQPDRTEKKMDLISRSMLAGVLVATDKFDCLNQFVQLSGLLVLDEWLQDIHKRKIGDGNNSKDADKSMQEFLLVLLRALDKLPVNLHALKLCNIGRSVNLLRSHKNLEIQKKARSLVDTWKKRVEVEMNMIDAKSGPVQSISAWSSKSRLPEASPGGSKNPSGSDVALKSSLTQLSTSKTTVAKSSHGESNTKSPSSSSGQIKSASSPASDKESQPRVSVGNASHVTLVLDEKSSNSQWNNYNQSLSVREDGKGSNTGSMGISRISPRGSRHRKSTNGFPEASVMGDQKETGSSRSSSVRRNTALEESAQSALSSEKILEVPIIEGSNHKLIVKIPNRVRSPAQGASGGSLDDLTIMSSKVSSPVRSEKNDQVNRNLQEKNDAHQSNITSDVVMELWQCNEFKDALTGSDEGDRSPAACLDEERKSRTTEDPKRAIEVSERSELKSNSHQASFSSMNALIESCVKYSEANASVSLEDDIGMNLLASVATGELSRSNSVSPTDYSERNTPAVDKAYTGNELKSKSSLEDHVADSDNRKQDVAAHTPSHNSEDNVAEESNKDFNSAGMGLRTIANPQKDTSEKFSEMKDSSAFIPSSAVEKVIDDKLSNQVHEEKEVLGNVNYALVSSSKLGGNNILTNEYKVATGLLSAEDSKQTTEILSSNQPSDDGLRTDDKEVSNIEVHAKKKLPASVTKSDFTERTDNEKHQQTRSSEKLISEYGNEVKVEGGEDGSVNKQSERQNFKKEVDRKIADDQSKVGVVSSVNVTGSENIQANIENKEFSDCCSGVSLPQKESPAISSQEAHENAKLIEIQLPSIDEDKTEERPSSVAEASFSSDAAGPVPDAKIKFDLNEGFTTDDGKYGEPVNFITPASTTVNVVNPMTLAINHVSSGVPASVTVAAAAKGPFVPPEDLLRSKGELGWKGSAATSAFRPAEPRKVNEISSGSANVSRSDASTSGQGHPLLDIDLNVPDDRVLEEMSSRDSDLAIGATVDFVSNRHMAQKEFKGGVSSRGSEVLDLDLNRVDDANDMGQCSASSNHKVDGPIMSFKLSDGVPSGDVRRDFDLNDGPGVDDASLEQLSLQQHNRGSIPFQLPTGGVRTNNPELMNFSSWFPTGNTYSPVAISSMLPERGDQPFPIVPPCAPQRIFCSTTSGTPFSPDVYRGSVLSSSPAAPFQSNPFQYSVFPFGTTFSLPSATLSVGTASFVDSSSGRRLFASPVNSQFLGPAGAVSSQFPRPYVVNLSEGSSNGWLENNKKWGRQGLDLNAGPGAVDTEGGEEALPPASRQLSVSSSQALAEEQARIYSVSGGTLKRKEPEGGWDTESSRYRQSTWQ